MKRVLLVIPCLIGLMIACSLPDLVPVTQAPVVTEPPLVANASCGGMTFYLNPALAGSLTCTLVPESSQGMLVYPQFDQAILQGYPGTLEFHEASIAPLSLSGYAELGQDVSGMVARLGALAQGSPVSGDLPYLPQPPAAQQFHAQVLVLPFASGTGIRYLTQFVQMEAPVNNRGLIYTYQGLTADGQYWISATFPVSHPDLPPDSVTLPAGQNLDQFLAAYSSYLSGITAQLNDWPADSFDPPLDLLDALIGSLSIAP